MSEEVIDKGLKGIFYFISTLITRAIHAAIRHIIRNCRICSVQMVQYNYARGLINLYICI